MNFKKVIKKFLFLIPVVVIVFLSFNKSSIGKVITEINRYKDPANGDFHEEFFYECVVDAYNEQRENQPEANYTDSLSPEQLSYIKNLNCNGEGKEYVDLIEDVTGIESLTNLESLDLSNNKIEEIDLSYNEVLTHLDLSSNRLSSISLINNDDLTDLNLSDNNLQSINLRNNTNLINLNLDKNLFSEIDLSQNTKLEDFSMSYNRKYGATPLDIICPMSYINFENNSELKKVTISNSCLKKVKLDNTSKLESLDLSYNKMGSIQESIILSHSTNLKELNLSHNTLSSIDLSHNTKLRELYLAHNSLTGIDLSEKSALETVDLSNNQISSVDTLNDSVDLQYLDLSNSGLRSIILSSNTNLQILNLESNFLTEIDLSSNNSLTTIDLSNNVLSSLDLSGKNDLVSVDLEYNRMIDLDLTDNDIALNQINISHQGSSHDLLENNYSNANDDLIGLINDNGFVSDYETGYDAKGLSGGNNLSWRYNYNVDWHRVESDKYSDDLSEETIAVKDSNIKAFLDNFESRDYDLNFFVNDGTSNLSSGNFEAGNLYTLRIYSSVLSSRLVHEYDLEFAALGVSLDSDNIELGLNANKTHPLSATVTPEYATNKNVTWESSDTSVATVNSSGLVSSVGAGEATITVATADGEFTDECTVTVVDDHSDDDLDFTEGITVVEEGQSKYMVGIKPKVDVSNLYLGLGSEYTASVFLNDGVTPKTTGLIGTGNVIKIYDGDDLVVSYIAVIKGDVNGSGDLNSTDIAEIYRMKRDVSDYSYCYWLAADVNNSGDLNTTDMAEIYRLRRQSNS